jgi:hypothetical protein
MEGETETPLLHFTDTEILNRNTETFSFPARGGGEGEHGREVVGCGRKDIYENIYLTHKPAELLPTQDTLEAALRLLSSIPSTSCET